jgi:hypothetical protein
LQNVFCSVFELPLLRNPRKRDKTTSKYLSISLEKVFDMDFLQKYFYGGFELPLPRNAKKCTKKKSRKKSRMVGRVGLGFSKCTGGSVDFFLPAPRQGQRRRCSCQLPVLVLVLVLVRAALTLAKQRKKWDSFLAWTWT